MKKLLLLSIVAIFATIGCQKDDTTDPITPEPPVVEQNFLDRYPGQYFKEVPEEEYRFVIDIMNSQYHIHVQNNEFRDELGCWNYTNNVHDDENFSVVDHTPDRFTYRLDSGDDGYRVQTMTKTNNGIRRTRTFYDENGVEETDSFAIQELDYFNGVIEICDFDADYLGDPNYAGLDFEDPHSFYTAFGRDYSDAGFDLSELPSGPQVRISILSDEVYDAGSAARATICDSGLNVEIKRSWWDNATLPSRFDTMYHEFGHGIFDYSHTCDARDIMHTSAEDFIEECGDDLIFPEGINESPNFYTGFKAAVSRLLSGENQNFHSCASNKGPVVIED